MEAVISVDRAFLTSLADIPEVAEFYRMSGKQD